MAAQSSKQIVEFVRRSKCLWILQFTKVVLVVRMPVAAEHTKVAVGGMMASVERRLGPERMTGAVGGMMAWAERKLVLEHRLVAAERMTGAVGGTMVWAEHRLVSERKLELVRMMGAVEHKPVLPCMVQELHRMSRLFAGHRR
jgi:hypothetical protein